MELRIWGDESSSISQGRVPEVGESCTETQFQSSAEGPCNTIKDTYLVLVSNSFKNPWYFLSEGSAFVMLMNDAWWAP